MHSRDRLIDWLILEFVCNYHKNDEPRRYVARRHHSRHGWIRKLIPFEIRNRLLHGRRGSRLHFRRARTLRLHHRYFPAPYPVPRSVAGVGGRSGGFTGALAAGLWRFWPEKSKQRRTGTGSRRFGALLLRWARFGALWFIHFRGGSFRAAHETTAALLFAAFNALCTLHHKDGG